MKSISDTGKILIWGIVLLIGFVALPSYILWVNPAFDNALTRALFDVLLLGVSLLVGITFNTKEAEKRATGRWLPAAEMVCNELLTMSATIERMCRKQNRSMDSLAATFPQMPEETQSPIKEFLNTRCGYCSETMENLKSHVENGYRNWEIFISSNGEKAEIENIQARLKGRRHTLFSAIERDFPSESSPMLGNGSSSE